MPSIKLPPSLSRHVPTTKRLATGGAWFFVAFSLASVAWALTQQWSDPSGITALYAATTGTAGAESTHTAVGLSYGGVPGLLLALVQTLVVGLAAAMSVLPSTRLRRIGHRVLIAWSALWMANLLWLATVDLRLESFGQASLMSVLFACTVFRAARRGATPDAPVIEREAAPDETSARAADDGTTIPGTDDTPPLPVASVRQRLKDASARHLAPATMKRHAGEVARRARPVAATAFEKTRGALTHLVRRARPAFKSTLEALRRKVARLQNGWSATGVKS